jgi:hypothetical protein
VNHSGGTLPTPSAGTVATFAKNNSVGSFAQISVISGSSGSASIEFGDVDDANIGRVQYDNASNSLKLQSNNAVGLTIDNAQNATFSGDVSLTNVLNSTSSTGALRLSGGNTTTTGGSIQLNNNASPTPSDILFKIEGNEVGRYDSSQTRWEFDDVNISGSLSKGSGTFKITHPLDTGKWLYHSFVEAPRADNIYRGQVELYRGIARVRIDTASNMMAGTFDALNQNVQVFVTNNDTWDLVRGYYSNGIIYIECQNELSRAVVNWLVIGERKDQTVIDWNLTDENGQLIPEWNKQDEN